MARTGQSCGSGPDARGSGGLDAKTKAYSLNAMETYYDLTDRRGLPENLILLLDSFPREAWAEHPNFAGLVAFWLDRHAMFRKLCAMMGQEAEQAVDGTMSAQTHAQRLRHLGGALVQQLHGHHQIEDVHYFPILRAREDGLARGFDILDRDHHAMDGLLDRFGQSANGVLRGTVEPGHFREVLTGFETLLLRHLTDEEDLIVPVILKHGPDGLQ
ncbi:hemerythrin domain-containing protein [Sagittula sp. SSi028]|uniref:hemerythrin domain-containing protein n=1 Tax=Sagittula sp. SSi028 TaxID=3400636 RepID=UPI003AF82513